MTQKEPEPEKTSRRKFIAAAAGAAVVALAAGSGATYYLTRPAPGPAATTATATEVVTVTGAQATTTAPAPRDYYYDPSLSGQTITAAMEANDFTQLNSPFFPIFTKETGINVNLITLDYPTLREKYIADMTAGTGKFDMITTGWAGGGIAELHSMNLIEDLTPYIQKTPGYDYEDLVAVNRKQCEIGGKPYGIMVQYAIIFLGYRKDLFTAENVPVPKTIDDIISAAKHFNRPNEGLWGISLASMKGFEPFLDWWHVFKAEGGHFWDDNWQPTVVKTGGIQASQKYMALQALTPPGGANRGRNEANEELYAGKVAMGFPSSTVNWAWDDPTKSKVVGKVGLAPLPAMMSIGIGVGIPSDTKNKDAAWSFASWLTSKTEMQRDALKGDVAPRNSAIQFLAIDHPEMTDISKWVNERGAPWPISSQGPTISLMMGTEAISGMIGGNYTPEQAMQFADKRIREIYDAAGFYSNPPPPVPS